MSNMGAGLKKQNYDVGSLPKFEKNFYTEAESVKRRSDGEIQAFRGTKDIRVSGKHIPRPVETFDEAGFPSMSRL
jgi:ATP-dependent RNA helicase DDX5/DBP2